MNSHRERVFYSFHSNHIESVVLYACSCTRSGRPDRPKPGNNRLLYPMPLRRQPPPTRTIHGASRSRFMAGFRAYTGRLARSATTPVFMSHSAMSFITLKE